MADCKGNTFVRQDSGVFSTEQTPSTPQPQLGQGQQHPGAASTSPLSPIDETPGQHPQLDADQLHQSLEQLRLENSSDAAVSMQQQQKQHQQQTTGPHGGHLHRSNSASGLTPRTRPTNLPTNAYGCKHGNAGRTETITPMRSFNIQRLASMSDEELRSHPELQDVVDRIVRREVPESSLDPLAPPPPPVIHPAASHAVAGADLPVQHQPVVPCRYPKQTVLHHLNTDMLCLGTDGSYYHRRDYDQTEELGEGGFGTVHSCQDKKFQTFFAMKTNNTEDKVESIKRECAVLQDIGNHKNITQFLGAVVDEEMANYKLPQKVLKMLMELAENGSLSEMLVDSETQVALGLPSDQSLFYLQQVLYAVHYLHQRHVLHLDLKCKNILVFNEGRIVKLADFGTAVRLEELEAQGSSALVGCTPNFSAPEVVRNEVPSYSADVWSVMCVFVELLTAKQPWCYHYEFTPQQLIFKIGLYKDAKIGDLVPFEDLMLDEELQDLFRSVFKGDSSKRPTALDLLRHPLISDAHEYEKFFDEMYEDICEDETSVVASECPVTGVSIVPSCESHTVQKSPVDSGTSSMTTHGRSSHSGSTAFSSCAASPGSVDDHKTVDKSTSTPLRRLSAPSISSQLNKRGIPGSHRGLHQSSASATTSASSLLHSNSAPMALGRRHTLSMSLPLYQDDVEMDGPFGRKLKRTSSEHYVSNGPEVDSPEARTAAALNFLRSPTSSCPPLPPSSSPPTHNASANNSNSCGAADLVSQGTQTGSLPGSPLTSQPQREQRLTWNISEVECPREDGEEEEKEEEEEEETSISSTTWLGPGPNGGQSVLHTLI